MAYTLTNLQDDIKGYTEVGDNVFTSSVLNTLIKMQKIKFIERLILIKTDTTQHLI